MVDIFGPASAPNAVTTRPDEYRTFTPNDTYFRDCSTADADDGTDVQAAWLNDILAELRAFARANGAIVADPTVKIVPEIGGNGSLLIRSAQHLMQRGLTNYAADLGTANAIVITLAPALAEYKAGLVVRTRILNTNTSASVSVAINGLGVKPVKRWDGTPPVVGELIAGALLDLRYHETADEFRIMSPSAMSKGRTMLVWATAGAYPWTCPAGVYRIRIRLKGAGGGGGSCASGLVGGCGGGGGVAEGYFDVVPGTTYTIVVGAKGLGQTSTAGGGGGNGGTTYIVGLSIAATGGTGGNGQGAGTLAGGFSGTGSGGQYNGGLGDGSTGSVLYSGNYNLVAPGCGGGPGGQAGAGSGNHGWDAKGPGGGGGGTSRCETGSQGGDGRDGEVTIEF